MALISCPECGREISDTSRKCQSCGYKLKRVNLKKVFIPLAAIALVAALLAVGYHYLIYMPKNLPVMANECLLAGDFIGADKLYARMEQTEEIKQLREQIFYESRIINAAQAVQDGLLFPDTMILEEAIMFADTIKDENKSTETEIVYNCNEPEIVLHYLAQSKGGSLVDGYCRVNYEDGAYHAGRMLDSLEQVDSLPWYIDEDDYEAQRDFWAEQIVIGKLIMDLYDREWIGDCDLDRCNEILKATFKKSVNMIPAGDVVVTATPEIVKATPKP